LEVDVGVNQSGGGAEAQPEDRLLRRPVQDAADRVHGVAAGELAVLARDLVEPVEDVLALDGGDRAGKHAGRAWWRPRRRPRRGAEGAGLGVGADLTQPAPSQVALGLMALPQ